MWGTSAPNSHVGQGSIDFADSVLKHDHDNEKNWEGVGNIKKLLMSL